MATFDLMTARDSEARFNVIRLTSGPKKGQLWILPARRRSPRHIPLALTKAEYVLTNASFDGAYWYAAGLLQGQNGVTLTPFFKLGKATHWADAG